MQNASFLFYDAGEQVSIVTVGPTVRNVVEEELLAHRMNYICDTGSVSLRRYQPHPRELVQYWAALAIFRLLGWS